MSEYKDLTRWNRSGLSKFQYINGNAIEYLELLRQKLIDQYADPETGSCDWLSPAEKEPINERIPEGYESLIERQERLSKRKNRIIETYHQERRDWVWELSRTFARSCHILTEYANRYANEGYLGTATQWEHLRRLVELLDYQPAPPASATTHLVFIAKESQSGTIPKGFQVKNSPPPGGEKLIYETLQDLTIDSKLNQLRPKGWDRSDEPPIQPGNGPGPGDEILYSTVVLGPAINIKGVGDWSSTELYEFLNKHRTFLILDFKDLDPDSVDRDLDVARLWEWKAKARLLMEFSPPGDWFVINEWLLPDITKTSVEVLAEMSGNSLSQANALKLDIEIVEICLDYDVFKKTLFKDLLAPSSLAAGTVATSWLARNKPKLLADDIAMIYRQYTDEITGDILDEAEAATLAKDCLPGDSIVLKDGPGQTKWHNWPKGELLLKVSPRWKRKCWLNGEQVLRTQRPHGLSIGAYIGWDVNRQPGDAWDFSKIEYARVEDIDKRNLRLDYDGELPGEGVEIIELIAVDSSIVSSQYKEVVLLASGADGEDLKGVLEEVAPKVEDSPFEDIFTIRQPPPSAGVSGGSGLLPPGALPKIGSFLFPTPMLPMDLVKIAVDLLLSLGVMQIPSSGEFVIKGLPLSLGDETIDKETPIGDAVNQLYAFLDSLELADADGGPLTGVTEPKLVIWKDENVSDRKAALTDLLTKAKEGAVPLFQEIKEGIEQKGPLLIAPKEPPIKARVDSIIPRYIVEGSAEKVQSGDWLVGEFDDGIRALKINSIAEYPSEEGELFSVLFANFPQNDVVLKKLHGEFRGEIVAEGADLNLSVIDTEEIELEDIPESLKVGRYVLVVNQEQEPFRAKIDKIADGKIKIIPSVAGSKKADLLIYGNVVTAGHGERKPDKILGSGDATKTNQEFILDVTGVSFIPDSTKSFGVAADIEVNVAGRTWEQVSSLNNSASDDHHYAVKMTEEGYLRIIFGDGENGRRLPTGKNNVSVRYRVGSGVMGNQAPGLLQKPVSPHPHVNEILQPLIASGGGDMESETSLRENAPESVLSLERAVSLSDFTHLATSQSNVWQANAYRNVLHGGRKEVVSVVIVPAGGMESQLVNDAVREFLQKHAMPGVQVKTVPFNGIRIDLSIIARSKTSEFVAEVVEKNIKNLLDEFFSLKNRKLGQNFYLSEVYKLVESVVGVENSICVINGDKKTQILEAEDESTIIYFDRLRQESPSALSITIEEYMP